MSTIKFNWMDMVCTANYEVEDGQTIINTVEIGDESFHMDDASTKVAEEICSLVDYVIKNLETDEPAYSDDSDYFGEDY